MQDTYRATETLPDGRERVLVTGLTLPQMLAHKFTGSTWAVSWHREVPPRPSERTYRHGHDQ